MKFKTPIRLRSLAAAFALLAAGYLPAPILLAAQPNVKPAAARQVKRYTTDQ